MALPSDIIKCCVHLRVGQCVPEHNPNKSREGRNVIQHPLGSLQEQWGCPERGTHRQGEDGAWRAQLSWRGEEAKA